MSLDVLDAMEWMRRLQIEFADGRAILIFKTSDAVPKKETETLDRIASLFAK